MLSRSPFLPQKKRHTRASNNEKCLLQTEIVRVSRRSAFRGVAKTCRLDAGLGDPSHCGTLQLCQHNMPHEATDLDAHQRTAPEGTTAGLTGLGGIPCAHHHLPTACEQDVTWQPTVGARERLPALLPVTTEQVLAQTPDNIRCGSCC